MVPDSPNEIVPENVRVMHCPGAITTWLLLLSPLLPSFPFMIVIWPTVQLADVEEEEDDVVVVAEVVEEVVVAGRPADTLGAKTTSFVLSQPL